MIALSLRRGRRRGIAVATLCAASAGGAMGLCHPLIAVNLELMTGSGAAIGLNAVGGAVSTLAIVPFAPRLIALLGGRRTLVVAALVAALAFAAFPLWRDPAAWLVLRFLFGAATGVMFVASETWITQLAPAQSRARVLTLYGAVLAASYSMGAGMFALTGSQGWAPFLVGSAISGACGLAAISAAPQIRRPHASATAARAMLAAARAAPIPIAAGIAFGMMETSAANFLPVWGLRVGFSEAQAGMLLIAMGLGSVVIQPFVGVAADKIGVNRVLFLCALAGATLPIAFFFTPMSPVLALGVCFIYSGAEVAMYALGLTQIGARFSASKIVTANAAFVFAYGTGSLLAPPISGFALDLFGAPGVPLTFILFALAFLIVQRIAGQKPLPA